MRSPVFKYILILCFGAIFDSLCYSMNPDVENFSALERIVLSNRMSFAQQVKNPNTIYEIRYDFDLNGQSVNLPESVTIFINGGTLKNGAVVGNKSLISYAGGILSVELDGTFRYTSFDITWFGAQMSSGNELVDNTAILNQALKSSGNTKVPLSVPSGIFYHDGLVMPENSSIIGSSINGSVLRLLPSSRNSNITIVNNNCQVSDITLWGNDMNQRFDLAYDELEGNGITICNGSRIGYKAKECTNTKIYNLIIKCCGNCGLALLDKHKWVYNFYNVTISRCGNIGFLDKSSDNNYQGFRNKLPFKMQAGASKKLEHLPLTFIVLYDNIQKWNLSYDDPLDLENNYDPMTGQMKEKGKLDKFAKNMFSHFVFAGELNLGKNLALRLGYNYGLRQNMKSPTKKGAVGLSYGVAINVYKFNISYSRSEMHIHGSPNYITITTNLDSFKKH